MSFELQATSFTRRSTIGNWRHARDLGFRSPQAPPQPARRIRSDCPESPVEYAEEAATRPRLIQREDALFTDVANDTLLRDRLAVALAGCAVALEGLRRQMAAR